MSASAGIDSPDYTASIDAMGRLGIVPLELVSRLRPLAGFRNVLVHAYLVVDPARVHEALKGSAHRALARAEAVSGGGWQASRSRRVAGTHAPKPGH